MNRSSTTWEAANVTKRSRKSSLSSRRGGGGRTSREADRATLEAMLNRLSKAYNTSIECIGALHRADNSTATTTQQRSPPQGIDDKQQDAVKKKKWTIIRQVSRVARRTLEEGILVDPLVGPHATAVWSAGIQQQQQQQQQHGEQLETASTWIRSLRVPTAADRPVLTSTQQERTVQQIAYLALVNYADLLWSASSSSSSQSAAVGAAVLDRGIVAQLKSLREDTERSSNMGCWHDDNNDNDNDDGDTTKEDTGSVPPSSPKTVNEKCNESPEQTLQLIVWALMDATALDGSDPLVWLKLACACRRLGHCQGHVHRYHVLERHALEKGIAARPKVPNRRLLQAYVEWQTQQQARQDQPCNVLASPLVMATHHLELPRYSWAVLGRILLRACRGETHQLFLSSSSSSNATQHFSTVSVGLAPFLALPPQTVLQPIISYLDERSYRQLKQVCRSLSMLRFQATKAKIVSTTESASAASASLSLASTTAETTTEVRIPNDTSTSEPTSTVAAAASSSAAQGMALAPPPKPLSKPTKSVSASSKESAQGSRVSKRLRSQIITSGKRAERSKRRNSVDYCLYAIVLGTPPPSFVDSEEHDSGQRTLSNTIGNDKAVATNSDSTMVKRSNVSEQEHCRMEALERIGPGSLMAFVKGCLIKSNTPLSHLFSYVAHVSIYADQVFLNDHHGTIVLLSSVTDCLDVMLKRTRSYQGLTPAWSTAGYQVPAETNLAADQIVAIDILHAELRFKRCDREDQYVTEVDFDSDASVVERLVPSLGTILDSVTNTAVPTKEWNSLRVRYQWLVAGYYLWRSRISHDVTESREAEQEGLECIKDIIKLMADLGVSKVLTPHLEGIGRSGDIWKELSVSSLIAFQNKVQASSVVLKAQEQFIDAVSNLADSDGSLTVEETNGFVDIASYLLERYSSPVDSPESNYVELLDDFMGVHGSSIMSFTLEKQGHNLRQWFAAIMPMQAITRDVLKSMTEPCILSILVTCLQLSCKVDQTLVLFWNLIRTLERYQRRVLESTKEDLRLLEDDPQADSMSDDDFSMMSENDGPDTGSLSTLSGYARLLGILVEAFETVLRESDSSTQKEWLSSRPITSGVGEIFKFCASQPPTPGQGNGNALAAGDVGNSTDISVSQFILERLGALLDVVEDTEMDSSKQIKYLRVVGLTSMLDSQNKSLKALLNAPVHQKARNSWVSQTNLLAREIGYVCLSLGLLFSTNLARVDEGEMSASTLLEEANLHIERFSSTLLSLYHFSRSKVKDVTVQDTLLVPVAAAVIGFCGSAASTNLHGGFSVALIDFVDSDESAAEWVNDEDDQEQSKYEQTLRVVTQIVHLIHLTIGREEDTRLCAYQWYENYVTDFGPLLPLIASRVLNSCSDTLLGEFRGDDDSGPGLKSSLWSDYSVGTRKIGSLLDSLLHKVYRCLHGFNLSSSSDSKDGVQVASSDPTQPSFLPEGVKAAAQLYRCVMRTSGFGRKSPPKTALDTIQAALPEIRTSTRAQTIRHSLFRSNTGHFDLKGLVSAAQQTSAWEEYFNDISGCFNVTREYVEAERDDESSLVRQGIAHLIAQGPLPQYQDSPDNDARTETASVESELSKKFNAILFELSYGNIANCKNWVKAAQCCWTKAEMIADRIGKQKEFVQCHDFVVKGSICSTVEGQPLSELVAKQEREDELRLVGWMEVVGDDLSVFMDHCWSSFESLKDFSRALESQFREKAEKVEELAESIQTYEEITRLFRESHFDLWQQSWGGVFVSSLRNLSRRCMAIALFVSYKGLDRSIESGDERLASEICESLGTFMYSEVSGSQIYGHPMRTLTARRKRDFAEIAAAFYNESLSLQKRNTKREKDEISTDWDIRFMIGKCHEKIASTYADESFTGNAEESEKRPIRRYEYHMQLALSSYAESLEHGLKLEKDGALIAEQQGGSGHGATEVQYRLHATRVKCLIHAIKQSPGMRHLAEQEALRLVEKNWFTKSPPETNADVRDRSWNVLTDVVDAMIQCRSEYSCFHRSVYRHAQALLWAPLVCDPSQSEGSFGDVPGHRAYKLRGLNSGSAVESASSVIGSLFDRRRAQLCAVWVTQGANEAFEQINISVRKYDSLRGKYIAAYLETLELANNKNELETFWRWVASSSRDLPSYMHITAGDIRRPGLDKLKKHHINDSLIATSRPHAVHHFIADVKRRTNGALASVIHWEVRNLKASVKVSESHLKQAYSCFLRLNCQPDDLHKMRVRKSSSVKPIIEAVQLIYRLFVPAKEQHPTQKQTLGDWSLDAQGTRIMDMALEKCRELFPSLNNTFLSSRKTAPTKKKRGSENDSKVQQVFRVSVPEDLAEGDTFLTEIMVGETKKRLRLTVPKGGATTLRFTLDVPKDEDGPPAKQQKTS